MRNIAVDIGNTRIKVGVFEGSSIVNLLHFREVSELVELFEKETKAIISSVRKHTSEEWSFLQKAGLWLDQETSIPITIDYKTPSTLGLDRVAGAVGAVVEFSERNVLIADIGTCLTVDYVSAKGVFQGGIISPGLEMRLMAMRDYTGKLPLLDLKPLDGDHSYPGKSTRESMIVGAIHGIKYEIEGYIFDLQKETTDLHVILTGGDTSFFDSILKATIFVRPELILTGLNRILLHNETNA